MSNPYYKARPFIDATVLRGLLSDAFDAAKHVYVEDAPVEVEISSEAAITMSIRPSLKIKYHRPHCTHWHTPMDQRVIVDRSVVERAGFVPCQFCGELNLRSWCRNIGLEQSQVWQVINKHHPRLRRSVFLRLLAAIGEEPHHTLLENVS